MLLSQGSRRSSAQAENISQSFPGPFPLLTLKRMFAVASPASDVLPALRARTAISYFALALFGDQRKELLPQPVAAVH